MQDIVSKISFDDYTFDTKTIGYKSRNKGEAPTIFSSDTMIIRGGNHRSAVISSSSHTNGLTKVGLPYLIYRWHDDILRSRISAHIHILSGNSAHDIIQVRVSTDRKDLVIKYPLSSNLINPMTTFSYIAKP